MITIPQQLRNEKFIILGCRSKFPMPGISWSKPEEQHDADYTEKFCNVSGNNYGVLYSPDTHLCVVDADDAIELQQFIVDCDTYMVRSGRQNAVGVHMYLRVTDTEHELLGKKLILFKGEKEIGDVRMPGFIGYNVAPYSTHPDSGLQYLPVNDTIPIRETTIDEITDGLKRIGITYHVKEKKQVQIIPDKADSAIDEYDVTVMDFLSPDNPRVVGGEIVGGHPIHGSDTGTNLTISADGKKWWCRRCNTGGGVMKAIAVSKGIITCADANRELTADEVRQCFEVLDALRPDVAKRKRDAWKAEQHEIQLQKIAEADKIIAAGMPTGETPVWNRAKPVRDLQTPMMDTVYTYTDDGNARRFEAEAKGWLVYDYPSETWYAWDMTKWTPANEKLNQAMRFVGKSVGLECVPDEEMKLIDADENMADKYDKWQREHFKWMTKSQMQQYQKNMVTMAVSNMSVDFTRDSDCHLLACKNGIIDTRTGRFYNVAEAQTLKTKYPTCYIDCTYTPGTVSQKWIEHLNITMLDNKSEDLSAADAETRREELVRFLNRMFGMMLVKGNPEQIFVFFWGEGKNGKSTTVSILQNVLGEQCANPTLSQLYSVDTDKPTPSVAKAITKRVGIFSEADGDAPISSSAFKELTGETSTERFRMMHENNVRRDINCLPIGTTNDMPKFDKAIDAAIQRRVITIPFKHYFADDKKNIIDDILTERDAIFSMFVDELKLYLAEGMPVVPDCARSTQKQLLVGDDMYEFFTTVVVPSEVDTITRAELKMYYMSWCDSVGASVSVKMQRSHIDEKFERVLSDRESKRLFSAAKLMGIAARTVNGTRGFKARHT